MRAKWAPHAGKVGPGRLCPVFCPTLPKPWAKWAIVFISIYLPCLIYIIRYRLKRASIAYHMHISRHSCNYLICGRQFIYPMCRNSCTARFARPSPTCATSMFSGHPCEWVGKNFFWRPEWSSNIRSPIFQTGSFSHCTRAPAQPQN